MASKKTWKARARARQDEITQLRRTLDHERTQLEYHRAKHSEVAQRLQLATTSPDTKAAHEEGFQRGVEYAQRLPGAQPLAELEQCINRAMLPSLLAVGGVEQALGSANAALTGTMKRIEELFHPSFKPEDGDGTQ